MLDIECWVLSKAGQGDRHQGALNIDGVVWKRGLLKGNRVDMESDEMSGKGTANGGCSVLYSRASVQDRLTSPPW